MKIHQLINYELLIGENSVELFDYFNVDELHGLKRIDAINYSETNDDCYIGGMSNFNPYDELLCMNPIPYIFINRKCLKNDFRDISLLYHEMIHQGLLQYGWDMNKEEEMVTWIEEQVNYILRNNLLK